MVKQRQGPALLNQKEMHESINDVFCRFLRRLTTRVMPFNTAREPIGTQQKTHIIIKT